MCSGDLKASLRIASEKSIHKTSSNLYRDITTCSFVCSKTQNCNAFSIKSTDENICITYQLANTNIPVSKNSDNPIELWIKKNQFVEASELETSSELSLDSNTYYLL